KETLQKENHLTADPEIPLFGFVGRLVDQKGLDLLVPAVEEMAKANWQLVLLGTGDDEYHQALRVLQTRHPKQIGLNITFDEKLAKRVYSGVDIFLLPSRYEPCGLGQMFALRFGTVPLVRATGGLADTVQEFDPKTGEGNGFVFSRYQTGDLWTAMRRAVAAYRDQKVWTKLMGNGMACDFSWTQSARRYVALYERAERKPIKV
ncbi:MAG: glycosyltransferase, partial [Candidatus Omnitrophica bacterium]|nr:glycosyltransferase [Candidatus Omnitrophota bacterium]